VTKLLRLPFHPAGAIRGGDEREELT